MVSQLTFIKKDGKYFTSSNETPVNFKKCAMNDKCSDDM